MINIYIRQKDKLNDLVEKLLFEKFNLSSISAHSLMIRFIENINQLKNDLSFVVEYPYVDKVFRDSYYYYYSTKLKSYNRDCIRISIFNGKIEDKSFRNCSEEEKLVLNNNYYGFLILRSTEPNILGRSIISPDAIKKDGMTICSATVPASVNGMKFFSSGFPHSSQDSESISCAETTIWSLMEYFGHKYSEYTPVLPSKIINTLKEVTNQRQLPTKGLNIGQISYALRSFGFGSIIYSREQYKGFFENLLSCYVESGIPLVIALETPKGINPSRGHATLCIGHSKITNDMVDNAFDITVRNVELRNKYEEEFSSKSIKIFDFDDIEKDFVFNDDNLPVYHTARLASPTNHKNYQFSTWSQCIISHFIVPLHSKIYLEAYQVKHYIYNYLMNGPCPLEKNSEILLKIFLSSSRSYKNYVALDDSFDSQLKELIIENEMPKFIWIIEISNKTLIKNNKINGLIILDATEPNNNDKLFIIGAYQDKLIKFDDTTKTFKNYEFKLKEFNYYKNNLKANGEEH